MRRFESTLLLFAATAIAVAVTPAFADEVVLVLEDGQELRGVDVERTPEAYVLTLVTGDKMSLPASLITEVRLSAEGVAKNDQPREAPTGIEVTEGKELTGSPLDGKTATIDEQLAALGEGNRSSFRRSAIDPTWRPSSDWDRTTDVTQFNPSHWYRAPIDASWTPTSAYDANLDVFSGRRASWQRSLIDSTWWPTNGFRATEEPTALVETGGEYRPEVRFEP